MTVVTNPEIAASGRNLRDEPCPCCGGKTNFLYTITRFQPAFDILRCEDCGLEMQAEPPSDPNAFYDEDYYTGRAEYSYRDEREREAFDNHVWRARLRTISRHRPAPGDFLDVGCAFGGFVAAAERAGYRARGLDVSAYAVREGQKRGLNLAQGRLEPGIVESNSADVLTMIEVIEHLDDPRRVFAALKDIVRPDGLVVIQTANYLGRQARVAADDYHYYLPGHLYYYSTRTLRLFLEANGFHDIRFYRGTDFGVLPKLLKSRYDFRRPADYLKWLRIAAYHFKSRIAFGDFALTSSMVCYARRKP